MKPLFAILNQPKMRMVGKIQLIFALLIYFYFAWSSAPIMINSSPDWLMHFLGNCLLYGSFWWAFFYKRIPLIIFLALLPFSLAVEFGQALNPHRTVSITDMLANVTGLFCAFLLGVYLQRFIPRSVIVQY